VAQVGRARSSSRVTEYWGDGFEGPRATTWGRKGGAFLANLRNLKNGAGDQAWSVANLLQKIEFSFFLGHCCTFTTYFTKFLTTHQLVQRTNLKT